MINISKRLTGAFFILICMSVSPSLTSAQGAPESFADLSEKLSPAVVNVYTTQNIRVDRNRGGGERGRSGGGWANRGARTRHQP